MRPVVVFPLAVCLLSAQIPPSEYRERRERLRKQVPEGTFVLAGNTERDVEEIRGGFFQEPNFYYLTGWSEPGAVVVITPREEALFIPKRSPEREKWHGRMASPDDDDIRAATGFDRVFTTDSIESQLPKMLEAGPKVYGLPNHPLAPRLKTLLALRDISNAGPPIARLRMEKSPAEVAGIEKAIEATIAGYREAWARMAPGLYEYQLAGTMIGVWFDHGCLRPGYPPIIGSGPNATILHYARNSRRMDQGDLVLIDAGAECDGYSADITRTVPVSRKFTARQRALYEVVLGAERAAIAAARPGMSLGRTSPNSLHKVVLDYLNTHGKELRGEPLGRYLTHGISHHVGLEVHDVSDLSVSLKAGMVVTIEPGIYVPEENIGIRIEDMLLITDSGATVLTAALPADPDAIEKALAEPHTKPGANRRPNAPSR